MPPQISSCGQVIAAGMSSDHLDDKETRPERARGGAALFPSRRTVDDVPSTAGALPRRDLIA